VHISGDAPWFLDRILPQSPPCRPRSSSVWFLSPSLYCSRLPSISCPVPCDCDALTLLALDHLYTRCIWLGQSRKRASARSKTTTPHSQKRQYPPPIKRQPPPVRPCGHQRIFRVRYIQLPLMASFSTGSSTSVMVSHTQEEPIQRHKGYGTFSKDDERRRRRHSSHHTNHARPWAVDSENVQLLVCRHAPRLCGAVANSVT
jgi:hypothetical protein